VLLTVLAREFEQSCYPLGPFRSPRLLKARCAPPRWAHRPARSHGFPTAPISRGAPDSLYVAGLGAMTPPVADGSGVCPAANGICKRQRNAYSFGRRHFCRGEFRWTGAGIPRRKSSKHHHPAERSYRQQHFPGREIRGWNRD
jgi:hypothetical protein